MFPSLHSTHGASRNQIMVCCGNIPTVSRILKKDDGDRIWCQKGVGVISTGCVPLPRRSFVSRARAAWPPLKRDPLCLSPSTGRPSRPGFRGVDRLCSP